MRPGHWTYQDLEILRREFPVRPTAEVARILGRSVTAVSVKAGKLKLHKEHLGLIWTPQMLKMLKDHFATTLNDSLAAWIGVSKRTLIRKARELGLEKVDNFNEKKRDVIGEKISIALKKKGRNPVHFKKGERNNPAGEFKKGHGESPEVKAKRIASLKKTWRKKKERDAFRKKYGI